MTISPPPESIAVYVGGDLIGDALMKLPFVRALKGAWPGAHVTWLAGVHKTAFGHELAPLVAGLIDETIEEAGFETASGKILSRPLSGRRFDLVIDTQRGVGRSLLVRRIRHRVFVSGAADFWLSDRKPPKPWKRPPSMIGQMMELLSLANGSAPLPGRRCRSTRGLRRVPRSCCRRVRSISASRRAPAGSTNAGRWTVFSNSRTFSPQPGACR